VNNSNAYIMRRLQSEDANKLGDFFSRNNRPHITYNFRPFPLNSETARDLLKPERKDQFFIAEENGVFVAFSMLRGKDEGFEIPSFGIFVDWERQKIGYGNRLCEWTFRWADRLGVQKIRLSVYEDNHHALSLYKKYGFTESERRNDKSGRVSLILQRTQPIERTKIFASTQALPTCESLSQRLHKWFDAGIHRIELSNFPIAGDDDFINMAKSYPGELLIHHFFPTEGSDVILNFASADPTTRQNTHRFFQRSIEWSAKIGAPYFSFHAGYITDPVGRDSNGFVLAEPARDEYDRAWERFTKEVRVLAKYAANCGIKLLIENNVVTKANKDKLLLSRPEEFVNFLKQFSTTDNIGVLFDWGHWYVTACTYDLDIASFLLIADDMHGLHLHTNNGVSDEHLPIPSNASQISDLINIHPDYVTLEGHFLNLSILQQNIMQMEKVF
jgi:sugar phosphate isomerase/epimerase/ribosomal protein S18 acetylase RimI-like enzyme